jgi:CRISPR-associated protein Cmr1
MSRKIDPQHAAEALVAWQASRKSPDAGGWQTYPCKLVTPLYGGGVRAGVVDLDLPIRPSSIRGQLRFWWRIASGPFKDSGEMFARESAIWGGIGEAGPRASQVRVRVRGVGSPSVLPAHIYEKDPAAPGKFKSFPKVADWAEGYALFSAKGELNKDRDDFKEPRRELAQASLGFELGLALGPRLDKGQREEVTLALRWWASFGGLGARTRRGLGAVSVTGVSPVTAAEVANRGGRLVLRKAAGGATQAWKEAVGRLKDFRQRPDLGRNPGTAPNRPGRSRWPEADRIRILSHRADPRHAVPVTSVDGFPRAAFGLPIVFHFKDEWTGDPGDHVLEPADLPNGDKCDRLASPLILRPYWDGARWLPAALLLPGWEAHLGIDLKFKGKGKGYAPVPWPTDPSRRRTAAAAVRPMASRGDDALTAFMAYFLEP